MRWANSIRKSVCSSLQKRTESSCEECQALTTELGERVVEVLIVFVVFVMLLEVVIFGLFVRFIRTGSAKAIHFGLVFLRPKLITTFTEEARHRVYLQRVRQ